MEVIEAMKGRRSIRKYKSTPVSDEDVSYCLEAARWAPSWANTQCARYVVVRDPRIKAKLAEAMVPPTPAVAAIREAPIVIVGCAELGKSGYKKGAPVTNKGDWFMFDVALGMQNLAIAAFSRGLGTVHVGTFDAKKVEEILGIPEGVAVVSMTPMGYPDEEPKAPPRKELSELVFHESYSQK